MRKISKRAGYLASTFSIASFVAYGSSNSGDWIGVLMVPLWLLAAISGGVCLTTALLGSFDGKKQNSN